MRSITGLMVKDCLQLKDFSIPLVFWTGVFIALTIVFNLTSLIAILTPFGFGMMVVFAFIFDEMTNAERYLASLPFTRNEIVLSKYILSLITICIGAVVGDILNIIVQLISVGRVEQLSRSLSIGVLGIFIMTIFNSIQIPCVLKNGAEKSRLTVFTIAGIITLICMAIYKFGNLLNIVLPKMHFSFSHSVYN